MPDAPFTPIVLDPSTSAVSGPMDGLPPLQPAAPVATPPTAAYQQTVPLQAVPRVTTPQPAAATMPVQSAAPNRQAELHQQLETLTQEESKLLGTIKDWVAWIQGAETKKQALERELDSLNAQFNLGGTTTAAHQTAAAATQNPGPDPAVIEKQVREAEAKMKTVIDQQKIEEKKAFDNYSAGGINREGLLKEMDRISNFYAAALQSAKSKITDVQTQLNPTTRPAATAAVVQPAQITPLQTQPPAVATPETMPTTTPVTAPTGAAPQMQKILTRLSTLSAAQSGYIKQLLVDLPSQGIGLTVERAADGNGVIILAGNEQTYTVGHHFPDADLILAGLGADDVAALPTGTLTGAQITPPTTVGL